MMGSPGQLSLGHSLYVGLGAYAAAALFFHFGIGPWAGVWLAIVVCAALRRLIGFLAFRFAHLGRYFSLLTIAFAEFTRIGFDHLDWLGGPGGLFLRVAQREPRGPRSTSAARPRCTTTRCSALTAGALRAVRLAAAPPRRLLLAGHPRERGGRAGARHRHFRWKMRAVVLSAAMTARRRRLLRLLLQQPVPRADLQHQPLDRDHPRAGDRRPRHAVRPDRRRGGAASCSATARPSCWPRSASISPAPSRCLWRRAAARDHVPAERHLAAARARARLRAEASCDVPLLELESVANLSRPARRARATFAVDARRRSSALIGPNGAGKTTIFNLIAGVHRARRAATIRFDGRAIARPASRPGLRGRHRPHVPARQAVRGPVGARQRDGRRASRRTHASRGARARARPSSSGSASRAKRDLPASR